MAQQDPNQKLTNTEDAKVKLREFTLERFLGDPSIYGDTTNTTHPFSFPQGPEKVTGAFRQLPDYNGVKLLDVSPDASNKLAYSMAAQASALLQSKDPEKIADGIDNMKMAAMHLRWFDKNQADKEFVVNGKPFPKLHIVPKLHSDPYANSGDFKTWPLNEVVETDPFNVIASSNLLAIDKYLKNRESVDVNTKHNLDEIMSPDKLRALARKNVENLWNLADRGDGTESEKNLKNHDWLTMKSPNYPFKTPYDNGMVLGGLDAAKAILAGSSDPADQASLNKASKLRSHIAEALPAFEQTVKVADPNDPTHKAMIEEKRWLGAKQDNNFIPYLDPNVDPKTIRVKDTIGKERPLNQNELDSRKTFISWQGQAELAAAGMGMNPDVFTHLEHDKIKPDQAGTVNGVYHLAQYPASLHLLAAKGSVPGEVAHWAAETVKQIDKYDTDHVQATDMGNDAIVVNGFTLPKVEKPKTIGMNVEHPLHKLLGDKPDFKLEVADASGLHKDGAIPGAVGVRAPLIRNV